MSETTTESSTEADTSTAAAEPSGENLLEREGDIAADYLESLLDIADLDGDIDIDVEGDRASVSIIGDNLKTLIGDKGVTLEALQELSRLAVTRETGQRTRLMLDVGGYRAQRRTDLSALGRETGQRVLSSGSPVALEPMGAFDRKVVHDAVSAMDGVVSESEGVDPRRHIVVRPAS